MKPEDLQVGTNYFGRTITSIEVWQEDPPLGVVHFLDDRRPYQSGLREFCSWIHVKQGGEPTDPWHALWHRRATNPPKRRGRHRLVEIDGKAYRMRRGKLVLIPAEWVGHTVHPQTIRKRPSKKRQGRRFKRKVMR